MRWIQASFLQRNKQVILYGLSLSALLFLLKWMELRFIIFHNALEVYIGCISVIFTLLGIWLALKLSKPKVVTQIVEKEVFIKQKEFVLNEARLRELNLSKRELDVLLLMADGLSNQEIADKLFVSLNTIKTHIAKLFEKLDAGRRTQAIDRAKRLGIIA